MSCKFFLLFYIFLNLCTIAAESQNYHGISKYYFQFIEIKDDSVLITENDELDDFQNDYFWNSELSLEDKSKTIKYGKIQTFENFVNNKKIDLFLVKAEDILIIYNTLNDEPLFIGTKEFNNDGKLIPVNAIEASSFLVEKNKEYKIKR